MKIQSHSESHLVKMDDGSSWRIFPGDIDVTLNWRSEDEFKLIRIEDDACSHALVSVSDNSSVRVLPDDEKWSIRQVKNMLGEG